MTPIAIISKPRLNVQARKQPTFSLWQVCISTFLTHFFWLKKMLFIGLLLSLIGSFWLLIRLPQVLPMTTVQVEGELVNIDPVTLQTVLSQVAKGGFFTINLSVVRLALLNLSWIKEVQVHRRWPDTLLIKVQERKPVAWWQEQVLVDDEGHLFSPVFPTGKLKKDKKIRQGNLPRFIGPPGSVDEILKHYNRLAPLVESVGQSIYEFGRDARQAWSMKLEGGIELALGRDDSQVRLQRFMKVHRHLLAGQKSSTVHIDLRYTNGIAVQLTSDK